MFFAAPFTAPFTALSAALCTALAQPTAAQPASEAPPDILRGPRVQTPAAAPTLVEHDYAGRLKKLETPPEEAALPLLTLDEPTRARIDDILAARAAIIDRAVRENLELLVQLYNAGLAGDRRDQLLLYAQFAEKLRPLRDRGSLESELTPLLPDDQAALFKSLLADYRRAFLEDLKAEATSRGEKIRPRQGSTRLYLANLGSEIKRSYERQLGGKAAELDGLIARLGLTPEQEARIRAQITDLVQETKANPTAQQKRALFLGILSQLNPEQRRVLIREALGQPESSER